MRGYIRATASTVGAGVARGGGNPDLQRNAIKHLGISGDARSLELLNELYGTLSDPVLKRAVLESFLIADDEKHLFALARAEKNPEMRREVVRVMGPVGAVPQLLELYKSETSTDVKQEILNSLGIAD